METYYTDIMIDIETTGLQPDRNAILQIGAVKFNLQERTVCPGFFNESLSMPAFRHWDRGTLEWWAKQPPEVYTNIVRRQRPFKDVMQEFQQWTLPSKALNPKNGYRFWSKPTHFDYMFISSYFADCDLVNTFSYRDATDMNSYIRGLYAPQPVDMNFEKSIKHGGAAHDALNDIFYQLKVLFAHCDNVGK